MMEKWISKTFFNKWNTFIFLQRKFDYYTNLIIILLKKWHILKVIKLNCSTFREKQWIEIKETSLIIVQ